MSGPFTKDIFLPPFALWDIEYLVVKVQLKCTIHNSVILQICTNLCCWIRILPADLCNASRTLPVMHRARPDKGARAQCTMRSVHGAAARCIRTGSALSTQRWSAPTSACPACWACLLCSVPPGAACTLPKFSPTPFFFIRTFPLFCHRFFVPPSSPVKIIMFTFWSKTQLKMKSSQQPVPSGSGFSVSGRVGYWTKYRVAGWVRVG